MSDFDFDLLNEAIDEAPVAGFGPNVNFGKVTMEVHIAAWTGKKGESRKIDLRPFKKGDTANKDKGEYLQVTFHIDLSEVNPALEFEWKRRVDIKKSNTTAAKPVLTDWSEIVEPSLLAVWGKEWTKKIGKGVYCEVEDIPTVADKKSYMTKPTDGSDPKEVFYTAPRFVRAFKSLAECKAAREERFKKAPAADDEVEEIPAKAISDTKGLVGSLGLDQARAMLQAKPFGPYEADELLSAAGFAVTAEE